MRRKLLAGALATAAVALIATPATANAQSCRGQDVAITSATEADAERSLLCLVNVHRAAAGLAALTHDAALRQAARGHSRYMQDTGLFGHEGIGDGTHQSRAEAAGYPYGVGENIARTNFPGYTPREMFAIWRDSAPHNENMLGTGYETAGMGLVTGPYGVVGTQMFGVRNNGATDTAADLLVTEECATAERRLAEAKRKVKKARRTLRRAEGEGAQRRASRALKRARAKASDARAERKLACAAVGFGGRLPG